VVSLALLGTFLVIIYWHKDSVLLPFISLIVFSSLYANFFAQQLLAKRRQDREEHL
jgi:hypothetical protein